MFRSSQPLHLLRHVSTIPTYRFYLLYNIPYTSCLNCCCSLLMASSVLVSSASLLVSCCLNNSFSLSLDWSCCCSSATSCTGKIEEVGFTLHIDTKLEGGGTWYYKSPREACTYQLSHLLLLSPDGFLCPSQLRFLSHQLLL